MQTQNNIVLGGSPATELINKLLSLPRGPVTYDADIKFLVRRKQIYIDSEIIFE